jgi:hypothetical protein
MITRKQIELARENWVKASLFLFFKITTPYYIEINGSKKEVFAFLPEYGSPNGSIVCLISSPDFEIDNEVINWANENNLYYSFVNVENFQVYREDYFEEILEDWTKY